ncbi:MAG TPA: mechanosensitive ion channel family protein [Nitrospiraceae bacterium]|nr:mechanosensitive ion channel family protein [Nitrospiraceae bacterium]
MRNHATVRRLASLAVLSIGLVIGWEAPQASAQANRSEPTIRDLIGGKSKGEQTKAAEARTTQLAAPDDSLGRGVPRSSVRGFLNAARNRNYTQAAEYLDLRNLPVEMGHEQGEELARQLRIVLDRALWIDLDLLSASPEGDLEDDLPVGRDRVGRVPTEGGKTYEILLQRVPRGDGVYIWKIAGATVADIPDLYREFGYGAFERIFPAWLFDVSMLGIHLWLWLIFIVFGIVLYPAAMLITRLALYVVSRINAQCAETLVRFFSGPLTLLLWTVLLRTVGVMMGPSVAVRAIGQARPDQVIALAWFLARLVDWVLDRIGVNLDRRGFTGVRESLVPVAKVVKVLALAGVIVLWLDNIGYKVTALLVELSIGGIAVALASQKNIENIIGAVTLFMSRPVKIGDMCRVGDKMGFVEEIGLGHTRIRTLERSVVSIANAQFVSMHIDNLSARDRFWYNPLLKLRYETTPGQLRYILIELRKMLYAHPKVLEEPLHVRFRGFGDSSLNVQIFSYIGVTSYKESLEVAEDLNFRIMDLVTEAGSSFAVPAAIEYQLPGPPLDEERARAVEARVEDWKSKQALYFPNFPKERIAEMKDSLDYPPFGSPDATVRA